jgi:hypothetical protein
MRLGIIETGAIAEQSCGEKQHSRLQNHAAQPAPLAPNLLRRPYALFYGN